MMPTAQTSRGINLLRGRSGWVTLLHVGGFLEKLPATACQAPTWAGPLFLQLDHRHSACQYKSRRDLRQVHRGGRRVGHHAPAAQHRGGGPGRTAAPSGSPPDTPGRPSRRSQRARPPAWPRRASWGIPKIRRRGTPTGVAAEALGELVIVGGVGGLSSSSAAGIATCMPTCTAGGGPG
jgi:hypothetical protein